MVEYTNHHGATKLLGPINRERLTSPPFNDWYNNEYNNYSVDTSATGSIREKLGAIDSVVIYLGTWCGDSRREVPRFLKVLDVAEYGSYRMIGLESTLQNYKQSPFHEEEGLNIHRVPTMVFYADSTEVGRIVEFPVETLEKDVAAILEGGYDPSYRIVTRLNTVLEEYGHQYALHHIDSLCQLYKPLIHKRSELSTYGLKLFTSFEIPKSKVAYTLNCLLFPDDYMSHYALGRFYIRMGDEARAKDAFMKSLALAPENKDVLEQLSLIR